MRYVNDIDKIFKALGGDPAIVKLFGVSRTTPWNWRRDRMPADTFLPIQDELKDRGVRVGLRGRRECWNWRRRANGAG